MSGDFQGLEVPAQACTAKHLQHMLLIEGAEMDYAFAWFCGWFLQNQEIGRGFGRNGLGEVVVLR